MFVIAALLIFLSFGLVGYALAAWLGERNEARRALARRLEAMAGPATGTPGASLLKDRRLSRIALLDMVLGHLKPVRPLARMIRQAGLKKRAGEVLLYVPLLACVTFLFNMLIGGSAIIGVVCAGVAGVLPLVVVQHLRRKRAFLFSSQLPDALDLMRAALQAGHGLRAALLVVADEFPDPMAEELREVSEEMRLGLTLREALYNLAERIDDPDLPILVVGLLVADDGGGNLVEVLDNISYTIRERFKLLREMRVLTAQGRLSGMVLTALPFIVGALMFAFNPVYFMPMLESRLGHYMIAYALASILVGHVLIRRLVQIKV
jgi:tight adherence protein B